MRLELEKIQAENAALAQKVQSGRENIAQTEHRISTAVDEWKVREKQLRIIKTKQNIHSYSFFQCHCYMSSLAKFRIHNKENLQ